MPSKEEIKEGEFRFNKEASAWQVLTEDGWVTLKPLLSSREEKILRLAKEIIKTLQE